MTARLAANSRKKSKDSYYAFFDMEMMAEEENRQAVIDNLDKAIEEGWIRVHYQPIVRSSSGKVCNVEALARWKDPVRGMLMPSSFIPVLEEAGLIHKLDLCVVKQVLRDIRSNEEHGRRNVPVSINFSRADFDACDLVEEISALTDAAGVDRKAIIIEVTESMVGSDFEYMKEQIERFRAQGFQVWMDDFGSGYSSLDVLQSIRFDLIKFDMGFMRRLDEGENGKIILTEMMKMATSLGVDTVCEGVETEEQVRFLREIGCSKLQGYCFMKPVPPEQLLEKYTKEIRDGFEDPREASYYDRVGKVNLYDLSFLASMDDSAVRNTFDTVPMGVMEADAGVERVKYIRSNPSFRGFVQRFLRHDLTDQDREYPVPKDGPGSAFMKGVAQCLKTGNREFIDEELEDGSVARAFVRVIGRNPVDGAQAFAVAVLSVSEPNENPTYWEIANALAADYYNLYVIDLDTNDYMEYSSQVGGAEMSLERRGKDFFASARRDTMTRIYEEDREAFLTLFTKENVLRDLDAQGVFTTTYRLIDSGTPVYVNMKVTRLQGGNRLILGVSIIDAHMKQKEENERLQKESTVFNRLAALSGNYIVMYSVHSETDHYVEYSAASEFDSYGLAKEGEDFYGQVQKNAPKALHPDDLAEYLKVLTKENVMREIRRNGLFTYHYRLIINGKVRPVNARAALVKENDGEKLILGVTNDEEDYRRQLEAAYEQASSNADVYNHIARALARDCTDLFYVNMETNELIEFHTDDEGGVLSEARRGMDFFEGCERDARLYVHPDDQERFVKAMDRGFLTEALDRSKVFEMTYRRIKEGRLFYVSMKVSRTEDDPRIIVIAVSDIDELMQQRQAEERLQEERKTAESYET